MARLSTSSRFPRRSLQLNESVKDYIERLPQIMDEFISDVVRVVNENEGGSILADALPTAAEEYRGRIVATRGTGSGSADELFICLQVAGGSLAWRRLPTMPSAAAYTVTNDSEDRAYDANSTSVDELADVLGTLVSDLGVA